ncbi:MAG: ParB/RepB/Spo0J family partition protein [Elusimicrobia bacterium]|jgi:ParB/RepB/Spo0J family partition protein|nr:ParB/RepB/Spo0J family partition protein [Elusimicrobiota bacterium]
MEEVIMGNIKNIFKSRKNLQINTIEFDKNNPRGESEENILKDKEFIKLTNSIKSYGILEPLIVKPNESEKDKYVLIDGERRLRAAKQINLITVPCLIAASDADARILAYQIHMLRKQWEKPSETKSIRKIIEDLKNSQPNISESELKKKLREITFHREHEIEDLLILCEYDEAVIDKVISGNLDVSYLIQIKKSFLSPLVSNFPEIVKVYGEDKIREILVEKASNGYLVNTRFLMDKYKSVFKDKNHIEAKKILEEFIKNPPETIQESLDKYLKVKKSTQKICKRNSKDIASTKSQTIRITPKQETKIKDIRAEYELLGKNLSEEEHSYIAEALTCLEKGCLRAAVVMIWAAGISKIITLIEKDLEEYNRVLNDIKNIKKTPYKYYNNQIRNDYTQEDLRDGNDNILMLYLFHKSMINKTEYSSLKADYQIRCDSAHPTTIILTTTKVISIFEDIYSIIFNNKKLQ